MRENFLRAPDTAGQWLADAIRVLGALGVFAGFLWFSPTDGGILALALPALLVPRFLGLRAWFDICYGVTVLVAAWSNVLDLYRTVPGWDLVMHFTCTAVLAAALFVAGTMWRVWPAAPARTPLVVVPLAALAISALWEMVEWAGWRFISREIFVAYEDTVADMAVGGLGGLVVAIVLTRVPLTRAEVSAHERSKK